MDVIEAIRGALSRIGRVETLAKRAADDALRGEDGEALHWISLALNELELVEESLTDAADTLDDGE